MSDPNEDPLEYILHENGVHEFIIKELSLEGAYAYLAKIEPIYAARSKDSPPLRVILNSTGELLPLNYHLLQRTKQLLTKYPNIGTSYTAIITSDIIDAHLANTFLRMMRFPGLNVRFFDPNHWDEAMDWLLQGL